jgi:hypothetical protein
MESRLFAKIAIHGVPRSGTTWLGEIFNSSEHTVYKFQPLFSYALKNYITANSEKLELYRFFDVLAEKQDSFLDQVEHRRKGILPIFKKGGITHIVYKEVRYHNILPNMLEKLDDFKLIAIIRNPLATLYSWFNAPREFRKDLNWKENKEWRFAQKKNMNKAEEFFGYERWKEAAHIFLSLKEEYPDKVFLIRYIDLLKDTEKYSREIFKFCSLGYTAQTEQFIKTSQSSMKQNCYSVYKIKKNDADWKNNLNEKIIEYIYKDLKNGTLEYYLSEDV